ncbi:MAG: peptidoglycan DD-metalloendopeptidase family protein [Rhodospirillaceae bacterium]|nr:peptidoglycan DD-metalloendopeptidase family protein [Rhodospirillaceae bacterium]
MRLPVYFTNNCAGNNKIDNYSMPVIISVLVLAVGVNVFPHFAAAESQSINSSEQSLESVEKKLARKKLESEKLKSAASKLKAEVDKLNISMIAAAKRVQDHEEKVFEIESQLSDLKHNAKIKEDRLAQRANQFSGVLMALTKMSRIPTEALIVQPMAPEDMVRSAVLLRSAVPQLENSAQSLRDELDGISIARAQVEERKAILLSASRSLQDEQRSLEKIIKSKVALRAEAISKSRAAASQMRELSKKASTLRELMAKIEQSRAELAKQRGSIPNVNEGSASEGMATTGGIRKIHSAPGVADSQGAQGEFIGSISKARGQLPFPAVGRLVGLYGQDLGNGITRKGISIETRTSAQIISPFDGKVVFSGPFRGYGQLLIIDHGEGYHSLLAGLGRIDAVLGNSVLAGEPVGVMNETGEPPVLPVLYVEFRRNNEPVNPLPWLAERKGSNQG